jgi:hypothetical protein
VGNVRGAKCGYNEATTHRRCTPVDAGRERTAGESWFDPELFKLLFDEC